MFARFLVPEPVITHSARVLYLTLANLISDFEVDKLPFLADMTSLPAVESVSTESLDSVQRPSDAWTQSRWLHPDTAKPVDEFTATLDLRGLCIHAGSIRRRQDYIIDAERLHRV